MILNFCICPALCRYSRQAQLLSTIHRDQPDHPVSRAVYWINYMLRHNGAAHLRAAVYDVSLVQYFLLDVLLALGAAAALLWLAARRCVHLLKGKGGASGGAVAEDGALANGHCKGEGLANGKHRGNGALKSEKKIN